MSYIVISESSLSCPPRFVLCSRVPRAILPLVGLCAPPPLARFSVSFVLFLSSFRRLPSSFPPDVIRHLRRPLRRMLCGMFCVHCTGYYPPTPDSPYARWSDSRRYSAEFFSSFSFLRYLDMSYIVISDLRCPARPALSCARHLRWRVFLSLPPSIYV